MITPRRLYADWPRDYWHVREPVGPRSAPDVLEGYYIDMSGKALPYKGPARDGFPLRKGTAEGRVVIPVTVAQMALGHFELWLQDRDDSRLNEFIRCADWLVSNHRACPGFKSGWSYDYVHERLGIGPSFISAMGQGQGISVLLRAHQATGKSVYVDVARQALEAFFYPVEQGGISHPFDDGTCFYEEYPCAPRSHVLNGHIFAIWGLHDYAVHLKDDRAAALFDKGVQALETRLPLYDVGYWSRYCLYPHRVPNVASPFYHELHIAQLRSLFKLTGMVEFDAYAKRWEAQFDRWCCFLKALGLKIGTKMWRKIRGACRNRGKQGGVRACVSEPPAAVCGNLFGQSS